MLCLCLCSLASLITVRASAASNLIDPNLSNWEESSNSSGTAVTAHDNIYRLRVDTVSSGSASIGAGFVYTLPDLVAGHSFTLSLKFPTSEEIAEAWGSDYTHSQLISHYTGSQLLIGFGYVDDSGELYSVNELFTVTEDNVQNFIGKTVSASFVAENTSGTPCIYIGSITNRTSFANFFVSNFVLIDNDDNSQELKGIKGFLHNIYWDTVGGVCDEEDCPHSSPVTPHTSLAERFSNSFNAFFDNLNSKLDSVNTDINSSTSSVGGWFSDIGDKLSTNFTNNINTIKENFSGLITDMKESFSNLGSNISGFFDNLWNNISTWFDKFKPRVYEDLVWNYGYAYSSFTGALVFNPGNQSFSASVTDFFDVSSSYSYYLDYVDSIDSTNDYLIILIYDLNHNYIGYKNIRKSTDSYLLSSGYSYRFYFSSGSYYDFSTMDSVSDVCNSIVKIYADEGWATAIVHKLKVTVIGLFVPDESFFDEYKSNFTSLFENNLGFIYQSATFVTDFITGIKELLFDSQGRELQLTFSGIEFDLGDYHIDIFKKTVVDFNFLKDGAFSVAYGIYKVLLYLIFGFLLVNYGIKTWERTMSN